MRIVHLYNGDRQQSPGEWGKKKKKKEELEKKQKKAFPGPSELGLQYVHTAFLEM